MDTIRSRVFGRGVTSDEERTDPGVANTVEMVHGHEGEQDRARIFLFNRPQLPLFTSGRSRGAPRLPRRTTDRDDEGPKTPRLNLRLSSSRIHLPSLSRAGTRAESRATSSRGGSSTEFGTAEAHPTLQRGQTDRFPVVAEPQPTHAAPELPSSRARRIFGGGDPAEMHLPDMHGARRRRGQRSDARTKPKRFLYCFPWIKSRRIRSQILKCFISGLFLLLMLTIYLALTVTKNINNSEFTILLILIILFTTIFFCHGLIRLCIIIVRPKSPEDVERARLPEMLGPGGYAVPRRPIRVLLARDEEAAGLESETVKMQPPAYGLWRESVRVDPNRIYWQRNDEPAPNPGGALSRPATANRPPSYASDDGVDYVVEARPRSMAPLSDVPLPVHPSEAGRIGQRPGF